MATIRYYERGVAIPMVQSASIGAQNTFTDAAEFDPSRKFNVSVSGTFSATVVLQRSFDGGSNWKDVDSWTAAAERTVENNEPNVLHRIGIKTGGYTSGTAVVRISQ